MAWQDDDYDDGYIVCEHNQTNGNERKNKKKTTSEERKNLLEPNSVAEISSKE